MKKIAFIGTFVRDKIIPLHGEIKQSIGGLYHGLAYAAHLARANERIYPVANIGHDFVPVLMPVLEKLPNLSLTYVDVFDQVNTAVTLKYINKNERQETSTRFMPGISEDKLAQLHDFTAVAVNMISGADISLENLTAFRKSYHGIIYFDFHTLALGIEPDGARFPQRPDNWQQWIRQADIVQMNENEAAILYGHPIQNDKTELKNFLNSLLDTGPKVALITLGPAGVLIGENEPDGQRNIYQLHPPKLDEKIVDIIGCGDTFGAVFLLNYSRNQDVCKSGEVALQIASLNATFMGSITNTIFEERIQHYAKG